LSCRLRRGTHKRAAGKGEMHSRRLWLLLVSEAVLFHAWSLLNVDKANGMSQWGKIYGASWGAHSAHPLMAQHRNQRASHCVFVFSLSIPSHKSLSVASAVWATGSPPPLAQPTSEGRGVDKDASKFTFLGFSLQDARGRSLCQDT
jgi:hypothetical protein